MVLSNPYEKQLGLSSRQVELKKAQGKQNIVLERAVKTTGQILKDNICTLFNLFNVLIAIALAFVGAWSNMFFILVIAINILIGIIQELHARNLVERLSLLSRPTVKVIRDGIVAKLPAQELVEEDVTELETGNQVCADSVILEGHVEVDESLLSGEADPVYKSPGERLLSGSFIVSGKCTARIEHVGIDNYASQVAHEAKRQRRIHSELLATMRKVTHYTGFLIPPLGIVLFVQAVILRGNSVDNAIVTTAAGLLGMLPKGLVLLISISLAAGIIALSGKKVLVQELFALETLAHVDTLCLDKTGTLTLGKRHVEDVLLTKAGKAMPFDRLMGAFVYSAVDNNVTFRAIKDYFKADSCLKSEETVPFSSERKWSAVKFDNFSVVAGAPECISGAEMPEQIIKAFKSGKRVIAVGIAYAPVSAQEPLPEVHLLAYIVIADTIRKDAVKTLRYFQREGVALKLISGDNSAAVSALASKAGFPGAERYIDMSRINDDAQMEEAAMEYSVFGRATPQQKQKLIQVMQRQGRSVAMAGDGVNDLLALREADCSIAVAEGSDAARQVAQVVLLNSDFSALPEVLKQGRRVVNNITRAAGVFFVKTIYSVMLSLVCVLLNIPFPLMPIQITLIDLIIEGYPAFFMSFEPDWRKVSGEFLKDVIYRALPNAISILVCFLVLLIPSWNTFYVEDQLRTLFYMVVGTVGIQAVFKAAWPLNKLRTFLCVTMTAGFYAAVILFHSLLHTAVPSANTMLIFALMVPLSFLIERSADAVLRKRAGT